MLKQSAVYFVVTNFKDISLLPYEVWMHQNNPVIWRIPYPRS